MRAITTAAVIFLVLLAGPARGQEAAAEDAFFPPDLVLPELRKPFTGDLPAI